MMPSPHRTRTAFVTALLVGLLLGSWGVAESQQQQLQRQEVQKPEVQRPVLRPQTVPTTPPRSTTSDTAGQRSLMAALHGMRLSAEGEIRTLTLFHGNRTEDIRGCGAKLTDLPILVNLYMEDGVAEYVVVDGCLSSINLFRRR